MLHIEQFLFQLTNILYDGIKLYICIKLYVLQVKVIFQIYSFQKHNASVEICNFASSFKRNGSTEMC